MPTTTEMAARAQELAKKLISDIPFCPWEPNAKIDPITRQVVGMGPQQLFLLDFGKEALYGGAAGGGKSIALLMGASQFLTVPGYAALLLRKSYADLTKPGALMDVAASWWGAQKECKFDSQENTWVFSLPGGGYSKIVFGYLDKANDKYKYQGGAYSFIGFDELTQHKQADYEYLFSRMRRPGDPRNPLSQVPLRMRSTANPGGTGHVWVHSKFIAAWQKWKEGKGPRPKRNFYPALLADNPMLDQEAYIESLQELDPLTRAQLLHGDWNIRPEGRMFRSDWFKRISIKDVPADCAWVRYWDMASTEENPEKEKEMGGPDWTVGALVGRCSDGRWFIADVRRWRQNPDMNDKLLKVTALHDTPRVPQIVEQEPGSSGKTAIHHYATQVFVGLNFRGVPSTGSKVVRAGPVASLADAGKVFLVEDGTWDIEAFLDELELFPDPKVHDDQIDAVSGAFGILAKQFMGKLNLGAGNDEFRRENPWRPDVTLALSPADLAAGSGVLNEKVAAARLQEKNMRQQIARAWAV